MTPFWIWAYLAAHDLVSNFTGIGLLASITISAIYGISYMVDADNRPRKYQNGERVGYGEPTTDYAKRAWPWFKGINITFIVLLGLYSIIPDRSQVAFIIGGWGAVELAQMDAAQELPENLLNAVNAFLEEAADGGE